MAVIAPNGPYKIRTTLPVVLPYKAPYVPRPPRQSLVGRPRPRPSVPRSPCYLPGGYPDPAGRSTR